MIRPPIASLRAPILLLAVVAAVSAAGMFWGQRQEAEARAALQREQTALNAARARAQQGQQEARLIAQHLDAYHALIARGFVGEESRLAWIEAVHLANQDARLYGVTYTLSPRAAAPSGLAGGLPLKQTRMTLKMPLLVETDLPRFLDALRVRAPGLFRVDRCRLSRITDAPPQPVNRPELDAECELLWFTVTADGKEPK
jgi:type II secretory pathway pseudopilin PulG